MRDYDWIACCVGLIKIFLLICGFQTAQIFFFLLSLFHFVIFLTTLFTIAFWVRELCCRRCEDEKLCVIRGGEIVRMYYSKTVVLRDGDVVGRQCWRKRVERPTMSDGEKKLLLREKIIKEWKFAGKLTRPYEKYIIQNLIAASIFRLRRKV
jgi:hypothetical protein